MIGSHLAERITFSVLRCANSEYKTDALEKLPFFPSLIPVTLVLHNSFHTAHCNLRVCNSTIVVYSVVLPFSK